MEVTYKDYKPEGLATAWHENGQKAEEGTFTDGKRDGIWKKWDNNGSLLGQERFENGELVEDPSK